ncbi:2-oxo-hept-3-ene-1,7-dioate hydratase [Rhodoligotrophos appendicifer]|uniref:2-keto-4-pentenoate hydratase n=1 Tax=Rhodoligotrophos appendicifer TaxID=987056 RepID=UPI00117FE4AE|nr:hydratase [Rhodoligotrophos appendicifer]
MAVAAALLFATAARADCPPPEIMARAADRWLEGHRLPAIDGLATLDDALCAQKAFNAQLERRLGKPVAYKVGFSSRAAQERFGVDEPVIGVLYAPMLMADGAELPMSSTRKAFFEADLMVTVDDVAINAATTRAEVASALGLMIPFIEIPDLALKPDVKPDGLLMVAYNVLPFRGVLGRGIRVKDIRDVEAALAEMRVTVLVDGKVVDQATGEALMGHPLDVVLWMVRHGVQFAPGDMISLGSLGKLQPLIVDQSVRVEYAGLTRKPLSVGFASVK